MVGSSLGVPIGLMLFNKIGMDSIPVWLSIFGGFLVFLPIILIIHFIAYSKIDQILKRKKGIPFSSIENSNLMALLVNKFETVTKSETIETPEPTTIEFQKFYNEIMSAALPENSFRKLILVVDNLDRMNPDEAAKVWATMRAFLDSTIVQHGLWRENLWLLVPIVPPINSAAVNENKSLLDKTFQSIFEVPPPALLKWKNHLNKLLSEALPNHDQEDFHSI
ncbi:hypothetical protein HQN89_20245 [Paenibacillus frigoriresistens]|uniref:P-loop NTPase fold protein n=1 Tax=Paenibacillus alginolyticus TaxID=59839 RepID=UPI0015650C9E|nr:P-loop NTPase fold protein [Paenibacillus frigoriresistens]NRF93305.1 hypothetical protein [Paenibacillus frigoriresistens]